MKALLIGGLALAAVLLAAGVFTAFMTPVIEARHPPAGRFVAVDGGRLHLVDRAPQGREPAATVLLLHGASANPQAAAPALVAAEIDRLAGARAGP